MIIVTGGYGFVGANLVKALNERGRDDVLVVDNLSNGEKFVNLVDCEISDYFDKEDFIEELIESGLPEETEVVFHQGACSDTTEWDGRYMMANNYEYSRILLHACLDRQIPLIYASSASVYGLNRECSETAGNESPLNVYGYSKFLFDRYVRRMHAGDMAGSQVVGLRYFNVYGPREQHKGRMASVAWHFDQQIRETGKCRLFSGSDAYGDGEQRRDFVCVDDIVAINLWFWENRGCGGIYNCGTGASRSFNAMARAVIDHHGRGEIEYIPFPESLKGHYQSFTEADISNLRGAGFDQPFKSLEDGVRDYLNWMDA